MAKQKKNDSSKQNKIKNNQKSTQRIIQTPLAPPTKPFQNKRKVVDLSSFLKKEQSISPPTVQYKFSLQYFLKNCSIQYLILQCPNLKNAIEKIKKRIIGIDTDLLYSIVQNYLHSNRQSIWTDKYKPKNLKQCLHSQIGEKIKIWLKSFHFYRNRVVQDSNSFIDDYFCEKQNMELKSMRQFNWKLKGLIIKGRTGVGKKTTIISTAKDLQYQIYHCGNQCNQVKYLKQRNQTTQSECVKTNINRNQQKIQKTNKSITTFAVKNSKNQQQQQIQSQAKKIQLMHHVNQFYPEQDQVKFYNQLKRTVESSKIPFLMTMTGQFIPQSLDIYDIIQFKQAKTQDIANLLYLIYHVENSFSSCTNFDKIVQKQRFKQILNDQLENFQFDIISPYFNFIKLTQIFNKKLDRLFTFIQSCSKSTHGINLKQAQQEMKDYLKRVDSVQLMAQFFYTQNINVSKQESLEQQSQQIIDASKYLVQQQQKIQQIHVKKHQKPQKQELSLKDYIKQLDLKVIQDYSSKIQTDQFFVFNKFYKKNNEYEQKLTSNIEIETHLQIRKKIRNHIKHQYYKNHELVTSIKESQFHFIGFLIDSRTRTSRKNSCSKETINLKKLLKNNQINYFQSFSQFLKPNSYQKKI